MSKKKKKNTAAEQPVQADSGTAAETQGAAQPAEPAAEQPEVYIFDSHVALDDDESEDQADWGGSRPETPAAQPEVFIFDKQAAQDDGEPENQAAQDDNKSEAPKAAQSGVFVFDMQIPQGRGQSETPPATPDRPVNRRLERPAPLSPEAQKRRRDIRVMVVMIIVAVVMSLIAAAVLFFARWFVKPTLPSVSNPNPVLTPSAAPSLALPNESQPPENTVQVDYENQPKVSGNRKSDEIYTILVAGTDQISSSTDTIMLVTYDVANQQATVMSIPRDLLVNVRNGSSRNYTRVNTVYAIYGKDQQGIDGLTQEVAELVGYVPDFRVFIDWELVGEMVDAIGGVWYDVPYRMKYDDPEQDLHIDQQPGYRKLTGRDAMEVVRWRKNNPGVSGGGNGSDINRLEVQHSFLKAVLEQTLQITNITRIGELAELFGERVTSDLLVENLFYLAQRAIFGGLRVDDVEFLTMPFYSYGAYVYPNQAELLELINDKLNPYSTQVTVNELDLISVNSDGSLRSTSGVLANPSWGYAPATSASNEEKVVAAAPSSSQPPENSAPAVPLEANTASTEPAESTAPAPPSEQPAAEPSEGPAPSEYAGGE